MSNKTTSKTRLVRILLRFQKQSVRFWSCTPKGFSRFCLRLFRNGESPFAYIFRYLCVHRLAKSCGDKVVIFPGVWFYHLDKLIIGTNVTMHQNCYFDAYGGITIGSNVAIAHGCSFLSSDHKIDDIDCPMKDADAVSAPVTIGDDVWIGCGVRVLKGATLGDGCVVGAGAVVTRPIPSLAIAGGIPAKIIRYRKTADTQEQAE